MSILIEVLVPDRGGPFWFKTWPPDGELVSYQSDHGFGCCIFCCDFLECVFPFNLFSLISSEGSNW